MMKMIMEYSRMRWEVINSTDSERTNHPGYKIKLFVMNSAYVLRGLFNPKAAPLESYEKDAKFPQFKARVEEKGRLGACSDPDCKVSSLTDMLCRLTALTIDFVAEMRNRGIQISVQSILGSEWTYFFRLHYCNYASHKDHYEIQVQKLPVYCHLPVGRGRTIFKTPVIHRDILIKKKASYEIKAYRQ